MAGFSLLTSLITGAAAKAQSPEAARVTLLKDVLVTFVDSEELGLIQVGILSHGQWQHLVLDRIFLNNIPCNFISHLYIEAYKLEVPLWPSRLMT